MKVCDVVCNSIWYDPRVNRQITEYQKRDDIELTCVGQRCRRYDPEKIKAMKVPIQIVEIPEKYRRKLKTPFGKAWRECVRIERMYQAIVAAKPEIIHANDLDALIPAAKAAKKLGCRLIFDSHELCVENGLSASNQMIHTYLAYCEKKLIKQCDMLVCVSHAAEAYFQEKYHLAHSMVVTNCALKSNCPHGESDQNPGFEVLNHGQFYEGRGYNIMAKACALLKDYPEIKLAIRGFGKIEQELHDIVSSGANAENFRFYPKVDVHQLIPLAARSHVGVAVTEPICLNYRMSVSNKLFEYAAAGLPVILSDIPEHRYLNERYHFGIILSANTPEALAKAIIQLYEDHALYQTLSENARRMSDEINWENEFGKLIAVEKEWCSKE